MDRPRQIEDLADELLDEILKFLVGPDQLRQDTQLTSMPDGHGHGHVQGHGYGYGHGYGERQDLDKFRLVNRRFKRLGTPRKFCRFVLRFSRDGFQRLEEFLDMRLACYVRHFTYMVRPFYQRSGWLQVLAETDREDLPVSTLRKRLDEQDELLETGRELAVLRRALAAFSSLQQVKLLRLQDSADELLLHGSSSASTSTITNTGARASASASASRFCWKQACSRALTNLSTALLDSPCRDIRFVGPQISPDADLLRMLGSRAIARLSGVVVNITTTTSSSTDTHADGDADADITSTKTQAGAQMARLHSTNLTNLHIGFLPHPVTSPFTHIFLDTVYLSRLHSLSLHNWVVGGSDLAGFLKRHTSLRFVRLQRVFLASVLAPVDGSGTVSDTAIASRTASGDADTDTSAGADAGTGTGTWMDVLLVLKGLGLNGFELRGVDYFPAPGSAPGSIPRSVPTYAPPAGDPAQERLWETWVLSGNK